MSCHRQAHIYTRATSFCSPLSSISSPPLVFFTSLLPSLCDVVSQAPAFLPLLLATTPFALCLPSPSSLHTSILLPIIPLFTSRGSRSYTPRRLPSLLSYCPSLLASFLSSILHPPSLLAAVGGLSFHLHPSCPPAPIRTVLSPLPFLFRPLAAPSLPPPSTSRGLRARPILTVFLPSFPLIALPSAPYSPL
ncbi:hypothetical protein C8J57DRAFT_1500947 [Mycena rebaudengoi]|nr:hypothetical protein C8J57DRAFT_1500947 [Mycena rebaudengoi]